MWQCKVFFPLLLFFPFLLRAQPREERNAFVLYAASYDELLPLRNPLFFSPPDYFAKDSLGFSQDHHTREVIVQQRTVRFHGPKRDTALVSASLRFDAEGRFTRFTDMKTGEKTTVTYLSRHLLSEMSSENAGRTDSSFYRYDRSGRLAGICTHTQMNSFQRDSSSCTRYLYNGKGELVVAEGEVYGLQNGTFTYEYDEKGRLVRRQFLNPSTHAVLCTDTLVYEFANVEKTKISIYHSIRTFSSSWIKIDEAVLAAENGQVLSYKLFPGVDERDHHGLKAGWSVQYTYDASGKRSLEIETDSSGIQENKTEYIHSPGNMPDSVKQLSTVLNKGLKEKTSEELTVISYDEKGRSKSKVTERYEMAGTGRKKWTLVQREETFFMWKS